MPRENTTNHLTRQRVLQHFSVLIQQEETHAVLAVEMAPERRRAGRLGSASGVRSRRSRGLIVGPPNAHARIDACRDGAAEGRATSATASATAIMSSREGADAADDDRGERAPAVRRFVALHRKLDERVDGGGLVHKLLKHLAAVGRAAELRNEALNAECFAAAWRRGAASVRPASPSLLWGHKESEGRVCGGGGRDGRELLCRGDGGRIRTANRRARRAAATGVSVAGGTRIRWLRLLLSVAKGSVEPVAHYGAATRCGSRRGSNSRLLLDLKIPHDIGDAGDHLRLLRRKGAPLAPIALQNTQRERQ